MRVLLLVTLVASAFGSNKAALESTCADLKTAAAGIAAGGIDTLCAQTAAGTTVSGFAGSGCADVDTAASDLSSATTCTAYNTAIVALCDALTACPFSGKKDDPCFPSSAKVVRADGEIIRMDELKEGDEIVAATAEGTLSTDTVSLLSIAKPEASASEYIVLTTAANQTLTLTASHHVPVGEGCCSKVKVAKEIAVGDVVHMPRAGGLAATTVASKGIGHFSGLHSPVLTGGGFPVVDGLVTSFDSIDKVTLAKYGLSSLIKACKATGTCNKFRETFLGEDRKYINA